MSKSLCSITDLSKDEIFQIIDSADSFKQTFYETGRVKPELAGKVIGLLFFEPSTRTHESFKAAAYRLGANVQGFSQDMGTSTSKGETFFDTVATMARYCDLMVMRTPWEGSQRAVSEKIDKPVINAGDGANQHPTQTLLDLYSIRETQGTLDNLSITIVGDLKYGRTVHSKVQAMAGFPGTKFTLVSPRGLELPDEYKQFITDRKLKFTETQDMKMAIRGADIVYMTRIQQERFPDQMEYEKVKGVYVLNNASLAGAKKNMKILHPMPRVGEIAAEVDSSPHAYYFDQTENGVYVRMAILCYYLKGR